MGAYLRGLRDAPAPLSLAQRLAVVGIAVLIAASRLLALSLTMHDWDELLFASAVAEYDVVPHHPHPPGYPLFVAAAKLARLFTESDFHALQSVATLGSMLIFPAAFLLARELRFRTASAFAAAVFTAFLPTLWYYGGTGFSDVPALALILFACALLVRGARSPRWYVAGVLVTALACCIRPHLLLVAFVPALLPVLVRVPERGPRDSGAMDPEEGLDPSFARRFVLSWLGAGLVVALVYLAAACASSDFPNGYRKQLAHIRNHIQKVDSYHNPHRTPLGELAPRVFLYPFGGGRVKHVFVALAALGLLHALWRRRLEVAIVVLMFLPMAIFTWLMLDITALSRYAISYIPMHAFLVIAGLEALSFRRAPLVLLLSAFLTAQMIKWTAPALRLARTEPSPVVEAFQWIRANVPREGPRVFVQNGLVYHARYFIPDYRYQLVHDVDARPVADYDPGNVYVFEGATHHPDPRWFTRKRLQLWEITRPRFFEVGIVETRRVIRWGPGWWLREGDGTHTWRWMRGQSTTWLSPALYGRGELQLKLHAPVDVTAKMPVLTVMWNGEVIDRQTAPASGDFDLRYTLASRLDRPNELRLTTDQTIRPRDDARELGLSLQAISWREPAASSLQ
jgi:hypothetical protein